MTSKGLFPVVMIAILVLAVFLGHSQSHIYIAPKAFLPEMPLDGGIFLLLAIALIYGGKALYRKD